MVWDLRVGAKIKICIKEAKNYGAAGQIASKRGDNYSVFLEETKKNGTKETVLRLLGVWWIDCAIKGNILCLPLVNIDPQVTPIT